MKLQTFKVIFCYLILGSLVFAQPPRNGNRSRSAPKLPAFKGVTTDGKIIPNLFELKSTGVSTESSKIAAEVFLKSLSDSPT